VISHGGSLCTRHSVAPVECCRYLIISRLFTGTYITTAVDYPLLDGKLECILGMNVNRLICDKTRAVE